MFDYVLHHIHIIRKIKLPYDCHAIQTLGSMQIQYISNLDSTHNHIVDLLNISFI